MRILWVGSDPIAPVFIEDSGPRHFISLARPSVVAHLAAPAALQCRRDGGFQGGALV